MILNKISKNRLRKAKFTSHFAIRDRLIRSLTQKFFFHLKLFSVTFPKIHFKFPILAENAFKVITYQNIIQLTSNLDRKLFFIRLAKSESWWKSNIVMWCDVIWYVMSFAIWVLKICWYQQKMTKNYKI